MDFFSNIVDFFRLIATLIGQMLQNLTTLFSVLLSLFSVGGVMEDLVPSILYASFSIIIAVGVVKLVIGR